MNTENLLAFPDAEVRVRSETGRPSSIRALAMPFEKSSHPIGLKGNKLVREVLDRNADIQWDDDTYAVLGHNEYLTLGRVGAGTMEVDRSAEGLTVSVNPPDTSAGRDLLVSIDRGDINGVSVRMTNVRSRYEERGGEYTRRITGMKLIHTAFLNQAAYPDTYIESRSRWYADEIDAWERTQGLLSRFEKRVAAYSGNDKEQP